MARRRKPKRENEPVKIYKTKITYTCPQRGEVTETVEVKRYKSTEREYLHEIPVKDEVEIVQEGDTEEAL